MKSLLRTAVNMRGDLIQQVETAVKDSNSPMISYGGLLHSHAEMPVSQACGRLARFRKVASAQFCSMDLGTRCGS